LRKLTYYISGSEIVVEGAQKAKRFTVSCRASYMSVVYMHN